MLAFKGGAVMTLIDASPRLSADLDAVVVTGRAVRDRQVRAALLAEIEGRHLVTDVGIVNTGRQSLQYPFVQVLSFSGLRRGGSAPRPLPTWTLPGTASPSTWTKHRSSAPPITRTGREASRHSGNHLAAGRGVRRVETPGRG